MDFSVSWARATVLIGQLFPLSQGLPTAQEEETTHVDKAHTKKEGEGSVMLTQKFTT